MFESEVRKPFPTRVPEVQHAMVAAQKPRAEHRVRLSIENRLDQARQLGRVVLQIRVLNDDDVAGVAAAMPARIAAPLPLFTG